MIEEYEREIQALDEESRAQIESEVGIPTVSTRFHATPEGVLRLFRNLRRPTALFAQCVQSKY